MYVQASSALTTSNTANISTYFIKIVPSIEVNRNGGVNSNTCWHQKSSSDPNFSKLKKNHMNKWSEELFWWVFLFTPAFLFTPIDGTLDRQMSLPSSCPTVTTASAADMEQLLYQMSQRNTWLFLWGIIVQICSRIKAHNGDCKINTQYQVHSMHRSCTVYLQAQGGQKILLHFFMWQDLHVTCDTASDSNPVQFNFHSYQEVGQEN